MPVWLSWKRKKVQIMDDHDLIVQLHEHHNLLYYYMQLYLDEIPLATESTPKGALFQTSTAPETSISARTEKINPVLYAPFTNASDKMSSKKVNHSSLVNESLMNNNTSILMRLITPDSVQSQSKPHQSPYSSTHKPNIAFEPNYDLFEDFLDTHFKSSIDQQTLSPNQTNRTYTSDTSSDNDVNKTFSGDTDKTPSGQKITQNFSTSPQLQQQQHTRYLHEPTPNPLNDFPTQATPHNPDSQVF